jgi:hypothetical protein
MQHFPSKGQYESFINFLVNIYYTEYARKDK